MARAKSLLERAAATGHLPAVYLLVELLDREGAAVRAIELLQRQLEGTSTATLHQLLADLLAKGGQEERAIQHYSQALALDPKNEVRVLDEAFGESSQMVTRGEQLALPVLSDFGFFFFNVTAFSKRVFSRSSDSVDPVCAFCSPLPVAGASSSDQRDQISPHLSPLDQNARMWGQ